MELKDLKNKETIIELYYKYGEDLYENTERNDKLLQEMIEKEEQLFDSLTEEQRKEFESINKLRTQDFEESDKKLFTFAFSLGVKLVLENIS